MSDLFQKPDAIVPGTSADAQDINSRMDATEAAFDAVEQTLALVIKLSGGTSADSTISASATLRAGKGLGFDSAGKIALLKLVYYFRGDYVAGTAYEPNDRVRDGDSSSSTYQNIYAVNQAFTATTLVADVTSGHLILEINVSDVKAYREAAAASAATASTRAAETVALASQVNTHASQVQSDKTSVEQSHTFITAAYLAFSRMYLGEKAVLPVTDNDGNTLLVNARCIFNGLEYVWSGDAWEVSLASWVNAINPTDYYTKAALATLGVLSEVDGDKDKILIRDNSDTENPLKWVSIPTAALKGQTGATGPAGETGAAGVDGAQGLPGLLSVPNTSWNVSTIHTGAYIPPTLGDGWYYISPEGLVNSPSSFLSYANGVYIGHISQITPLYWDSGTHRIGVNFGFDFTRFKTCKVG